MGGGMATVLGDRNARLFLGVTLTSGFGNTAMSLAASVWVLALTGSAGLAALCGLCVYAPSLAGPLLGTVADRLPRRPLLVVTSAAMAALLLTLLAVRGPGQTWLIFAVMLGYGVSFVLLDAGEAAVLQAAVPADRLGGVNSLRMSLQEGMKLVAPLAGAALFSWRGGGSVATLAATTLGIAACCYAAIRPGARPADVDLASSGLTDAHRASPGLPDDAHRASPEPTHAHHASPGLPDDAHRASPEPTHAHGASRRSDGDGGSSPGSSRDGHALPGAAEGRSLFGRVRDGVAFLRGHEVLGRLTVAGSAAVAMSGLGNAAAYLVIVDDLGRAPEFAGVLAAAQGAGSVVGGLLCGRILDRRGEPAVAWWGAVLSALGTLLLCVPVTPAVAAGRVLVGVGLPWTVIAVLTAVQRHTPAALIGRVAASANTAVFAPTALTIAVGAGAVALVDHRAVLAVAAVVTVLAALPLLAALPPVAALPPGRGTAP